MILKISQLSLIMFIVCFGNAQIQQLSDEFNRTCSINNWQDVNTVEGWNASHIEALDINQSNAGQLTIMPYTTAWYANYRSNLLFKEIAGDFAFTIHAEANNRSETGLPSSQYSLTGTMIRTPKSMSNGSSDWNPGEENYVFLSIGRANGGANSGPQFEVKNTTNSNSVLNISPIDTSAATIRLVRKGSAILVLYQLDGEDFVLHRRYERTDFPDTMQVGIVAYTDWNKVNTYSPIFHNSHVLNEALNPDPSSDTLQAFNPDILSKIEFARFDSVNLPLGIDTLNLANENEVSDNIILTYFGYDSETTDIKNWNIWKGINSDWDDPINWSYGSIPSATDSILFPDCDCPEMVNPVIPNGTYNFTSMKIETGAEISIPVNVIWNINLLDSTSLFKNEGIINVSGQLLINNVQDLEITNTGLIHCESGGLYRIE